MKGWSESPYDMVPITKAEVYDRTFNQFFQNSCRIGTDEDTVTKKELWATYIHWCCEHNTHDMKYPELSKRIKAMGAIIESRGNKSVWKKLVLAAR